MLVPTYVLVRGSAAAACTRRGRAATAYVFCVGLLMYRRFRRGHWRSMRVIEPAPPELERAGGEGMSCGPSYPPALEVARRLEAYFEVERRAVDPGAVEELIVAGFWASLRREEGRGAEDLHDPAAAGPRGPAAAVRRPHARSTPPRWRASPPRSSAPASTSAYGGSTAS